MALSPKQIAGLREHAARGEGAEKENAISILNKNGIPLTEPQTKTGKGSGSWMDNPPWERGAPPPKRPTGRDRTDTFTAGFKARNGGMSDFEEAIKNASAEFDGVFSTYKMDNDPFFNEKLRIPGIETKMQAQIVNIISQKIFGKRGMAQWVPFSKYCLCKDLSEGEIAAVVMAYKANAEPMMNAALKAMKDYTLI